MADFNSAVEIVLKHEGGYVNDPADPGGETKYGISKRAYPAEDIKNLTVARAKEIYRRDYWNKINGDQIKSQEAANSVFDMAINSGVSRAQKLLQQALKMTGYKTIAEVPESAGKALARAYGVARIQFYRDLVQQKPALKKFLKGWESRARSFFNYSPASVALMLGGSAAFFWWLWKRRKHFAEE